MIYVLQYLSCLANPAWSTCMFSNCQSTRLLRSTKVVGGWFTSVGRRPNPTMPTQTPGMWGGWVKASWKGGPKKRSLSRTRAWSKTLWRNTLMARVSSDGRALQSFRAVSGGLNGMFRQHLNIVQAFEQSTLVIIGLRSMYDNGFSWYLWSADINSGLDCNVCGICLCACGITLDYLCRL